MSRIHDMGGRFGDGPVPDKTDNVVFHSRWEARALATTLACGALGAWNIDAGRHSRERLRPRDYARFSYFEKWIAGLANLLVERDLLTLDDLARAAGLPEGRARAPDVVLSPKALRADAVWQTMHDVVPYRRQGGPAPRFKVGDRVKTASYPPNHTPKGGHTRLPAYAMGRIGTIVMRHGTYVLPDSNAHFHGEAPEPLYAVEFDASTLWDGDAEDSGDRMVLDMWQNYLEPVTV